MNLAERQIWLDGKQLADVCGSKCGLITVTAFEDEYVFQLNCLLCPNVFSCFENFASHIKIKHQPLSCKNLRKDTDNERDRKPDELACGNLSISEEFQNKIKVDYEETSNVSLSRELQENQSNDDANFLSEDGEHAMETLSSVDPYKIDEFYVYELSEGSHQNAKEVLKQTEEIVPPVPASSQYQPVEELPHVNLPKDSKFYHPKNEIKLEYEETSDFNLNQELLATELQENQSNDFAEFLLKDEHSVELSHETSLKDSKVCRVQRMAIPKNYNLTLEIIKMWKNYPYLWNNKRDNRTKKKREETWDKIVQLLKQKWNCDVPKNDLLRKIRSMRGQYYEALRNTRKATTSKKVLVPWFFEELSFLAPKTYYCEECDEFFRSEDSFKYHQYTHDGIKRFVCDVCEKLLASVNNLKMHKQIHVCFVVQENQSNDDAKPISEDGEHSMETVSSVGPCKIEEFNVSKLSKGSLLNTKEVLEKSEKIVSPVPASSQYQPVEELPHVNLPKDSKFYHPKNEIKLEYEETSNVNLNQEPFCTELQENQSNDCAELLSESQHSVEPSHVTSSKDSKMEILDNYNSILDIIKMWKNHPCLWSNKRDNRTNKKRDETWDKMVHLLKQKWNCEVRKDALIRKICCMRRQYNDAVRKSRNDTTSKKVPVPWFFEELSFLKPRTYYNCEECDEVFRSEDSFKYHQYTHDGIARFICDVCYKEFTSVRLLSRHKVTHLDVSDRPHECKICGRKFPIKAQLTVHMRRHTKENCLACSECNKLFPTKGALRNHMRSKTVHSSTSLTDRRSQPLQTDAEK